MPVLLVEARGYLLFFFLVFGDGVGWDFYGDAIARSILTRYRVFRLGRRHQVHRNGAYETLNAIPTSGIAFGEELFLSIAVIDIEDLPRVSPDLRFLAGPIRRSRARHPWVPPREQPQDGGFR